MQENVIALGMWERPVFHVESGSLLKSLTAATIYLLPRPRLVLTREISTPNATDVTVSYTVISGDTFEDWKRNLEEADLMIWKPLPGRTNGQERN
jgi:hypothetical protein